MHALASLDEIVAWLDADLDVARYAALEPGSNGLLYRSTAQPGVSKVAVAVNTSFQTIVGAARAGAQLLVVHHTTWPAIDLHLHDEKRSMLEQAGLSLYGAHHSLDNAPGFGNAYALADVLGLAPGEPFGELDGGQPGLACDVGGPFGEFVQRVSSALGTQVEAHQHAKTFRRVGIVPGAGGMTSFMDAALKAGCDTFLTGEGSMYTRMFAKEAPMNLLFGTHQATETPGIRALGARLGDHARIEWEFIDESPDVF